MYTPIPLIKSALKCADCVQQKPIMFQPLQEAYYFFKKNLWAVVLVLFPLLLPVLLLQHLVDFAAAPFLKAMPWLSMIPAAIELLARPFYTGALVSLLANLIQKKPWSIKGCYLVSLQYWVPLFLLTVYCNTIVSIGFLAFIVPGIWFFARYAFVNFLTVLDQLSFTAAIQKSSELTLPYRVPIMASSGFLLASTMLFYVGSRAWVDHLMLGPAFEQGISFAVDVVGFLMITLLDILLFRFFCLAANR